MWVAQSMTTNTSASWLITLGIPKVMRTLTKSITKDGHKTKPNPRNQASLCSVHQPKTRLQFKDLVRHLNRILWPPQVRNFIRLAITLAFHTAWVKLCMAVHQPTTKRSKISRGKSVNRWNSEREIKMWMIKVSWFKVLALCQSTKLS